MKRNIPLLTKLFGISLFFIILIIVSDCKKAKQQNTSKTGTFTSDLASSVNYPLIDSMDISYITNKAIMWYGMLSFNTRADFEDVAQKIVDLNKAMIIPDSLQDSIPEFPISVHFEEHFNGFFSLRNAICKEIDSLQELGMYNPQVYDPDDHFLADDGYRTLFNKELEVRIGELAYKILSEEWVAEFKADESDLTTVKGISLNELTGQYKDTIIRGIYIYYCGLAYSQGKIVTPRGSGCNVQLGYQADLNNKKLYHFAAGGNGNCTYSWDFGDGTSGTGQSIDHTYTSQGDYMVILTANCVIDQCIYHEIITVEQKKACTGPSADFTMTQTNAEISFNANSVNSNFYYEWELDGGLGAQTIQSFGKGHYSETNNYASGGGQKAYLTVFDGTGCSAKMCKTVALANVCCEKGHHQVIQYYFYTPSNDKAMKCKIFRWNAGPFGRNVGAKTVNLEYRYKKHKNKGKQTWRRTKTTIYAELYGKIWVRDRPTFIGSLIGDTPEKPCPQIGERDVSTNEFKTNAKNADVTWNPSGIIQQVYTQKKRLKSKHYVKNALGNYFTVELFLTDCP